MSKIGDAVKFAGKAFFGALSGHGNSPMQAGGLMQKLMQKLQGNRGSQCGSPSCGGGGMPAMLSPGDMRMEAMMQLLARAARSGNCNSSRGPCRG